MISHCPDCSGAVNYTAALYSLNQNISIKKKTEVDTSESSLFVQSFECENCVKLKTLTI